MRSVPTPLPPFAQKLKCKAVYEGVLNGWMGKGMDGRVGR